MKGSEKNYFIYLKIPILFKTYDYLRFFILSKILI